MEEDRGGKGPAFTRPAMRAGLRCASETMGADGWPAADVARPVTDACERAHPPMESISAVWQSLTCTVSADLDCETETQFTGKEKKKQVPFMER